MGAFDRYLDLIYSGVILLFLVVVVRRRRGSGGLRPKALALSAIIVLLIIQATVRETVCRYLKPVVYYHLYDPYLRLTYTENPGIAFGFTFLRQYGAPLGLGAIIIILILLVGISQSKFTLTALTLILAGAIENVSQRVSPGYVVVYIDSAISESYRWPIFSLADALIVVGAIMLVAEIVWEK